MHTFLTRLTITAACGLAFAGAQTKTAHDHWVLLPATEAPAAMRQCSRNTPQADQGWLPSAVAISILESHLGEIAQLAAARPPHPPVNPQAAYRQYVGVIIHGHEYIYVNASGQPHGAQWQTKVSIVCDGGSAFWGVLYDPTTSAFSDLQFNG